MPSVDDFALMAHLMRRAGFGANRDELEAYVTKGYEATVERLLHPVDDAYLERDVVDRCYIEIEDQRQATSAGGWWLLPDDQHPQPAAGKDDAVLAWALRHRLREDNERPGSRRSD